MKRKPNIRTKIKRAKQSCCPWCASYETGYEDVNVGAGQAEQYAQCNDCDKRWVEVYLISNIVEVES